MARGSLERVSFSSRDQGSGRRRWDMWWDALGVTSLQVIEKMTDYDVR